MNSNAPIGVVVIARHGFYQNPDQYTASDTQITPLGENQCFRLGAMVRDIYADGNGSTRAIAGLSSTTLVPAQINSTADAGGEGSTIWDSAVSFWQGFYPPNLSVSNQTLANGETVTSPLQGYQYVQVDTVLPSDDVDFEPWTNCNAWTNRTNEFYSSAAFKNKQQEVAPYFTELQNSNILGNRTVSLKNAFNMFDYMNVQNIHNATFAAELAKLPNGTLAQAADLASWLQYSLFTDSKLDGLGNLAGRAIFPRITNSLSAFTAKDNDVKIAHYHMSYKPFLSIFNMTNLAASSDPVFPYPRAMVDYASVAVFELRPQGSGPSGHDVRFGFKNGSSNANDVTYYPLFGTSSVDMDLSTFTANIQSSTIANNSIWCGLCGNNGSVPACMTWALAQDYANLADKYKSLEPTLSNASAGGIGAGVTIVLGLVVLALMRIFGLISFGKRRSDRSTERFPLKDRESYKGSIASSFQ
ncbi:uncharacterized protein JCM15063_006087 [Sporobolomyces koalae]|uniref:uncharacterized protein n=1 Tax=Sporobolomyces koalae TaxID=500713 RepID=UPI00317C1CA0